MTDDDREADREALAKLTSMVEERVKSKPLPPPPALPPGDIPKNPNIEVPAKSRDRDSDTDLRNGKFFGLFYLDSRVTIDSIN